jgi:DNA-binding NarL/FixJ family response regulator
MGETLATIRILVVEQPAVMRRTLCARLAVEPDMRVVADADNIASAANLANELQPHIILLDTEMPGLNLREAVQMLRASNASSRVVVLTLDPAALAHQLDAGMAAVIGKHEGVGSLVVAIRAAGMGQHCC